MWHSAATVFAASGWPTLTNWAYRAKTCPLVVAGPRPEAGGSSGVPLA
jgi:hypothetical protein